MRYYELRYSLRHDDGMTFTHLRILWEESNRLLLDERITRSSMWNNPEPINMEVDEENGVEVRFSDIYRVINRPEGYILVVSKRMKETLELFTMPEHSWYEVKVVYKGVFHELFMLHLVDNRLKELDHSKIRFDIYKAVKDKSYVRSLKSGEIENFNQLHELRLKEIKESKNSVIPEVYHYKNKYNLFWGDGLSILVDERLKNEIEKHDFVLVEFKEYTKKKIIMPE